LSWFETKVAEIEAKIRANEEAKAELQQIIDKLSLISNQLKDLAAGKMGPTVFGMIYNRKRITNLALQVDGLIHDLKVQVLNYDRDTNIRRAEIRRITLDHEEVERMLK
jgi:predicted ATPase